MSPLVAVATRMSLSLSLYCFLRYCLCCAGDAVVNPAEKNRHDISEREEGEKVPTSPTTVAPTQGCPVKCVGYILVVKSIRCSSPRGRLSKFDRAGEKEEKEEGVVGSMWRFSYRFPTKQDVGRSWQNRECSHSSSRLVWLVK